VIGAMVGPGKVSILAVDDEPRNLIALESILADEDINLVKARSGEEALKQLLKHDFALILLDLHMPEMDGFETASLIRRRARSRSSPIIFMTADYGADTQVATGYSIGAVDYMFKPLDPDVLRSKVAVFVELFAKNRQVEVQAQLLADAGEKLQASNEELEDRNRLIELADGYKSQFLANMSHELRTPLNAILCFSELLIDDVSGRIDSKTRLKFLNQINSSGQHLLSLISDILDLAKVEAGRIELHLAKTAVAEAIDVVVRTVEALAAKKNITIVSEPGRDLYLTADPGKLKQMLLNLVSNGLKFTPTGGQVTIAAHRDGSIVEISVSDTGIGISEADLQLIFKEFKQLDQGLDRHQEGTGLGLALTKRFAELHGGTVSVKSLKGIGSTFTLRLPVEPPGPKTEPSPESTLIGTAELARPAVLVLNSGAIQK
jgi:signal transduction histidine kinase